MKKILIFLILGMFLLTGVNAISQLDDVRQGDCVDLFQYCDDCTYVNWTGMEYPNGTIDVSINKEMTKTNRNFKYTYCGVNKTGNYKYFVTGNKDGIDQQEEISFKVTLSGEPVDGKDITARLMLILFFSTLLYFINSSANKINLEQWYKKLKTQYEHRNYVKISLGAIAYQLMKNIWVTLYTIGFIIVILLMDVIYLFSIEALYGVMKVITEIYAWSFILVGLVFLSYLQEFFKGLLEQIENENWGASK